MGTTRVIFSHDDTKKWSVYVEGEQDEKEARLAFAAVILSCAKLNPVLQMLAGVTKLEDGSFEITPAVTDSQPSIEEIVGNGLNQARANLLANMLKEASDRRNMDKPPQ